LSTVTNLLHSAAQESIPKKKFRKNPYWKESLNEFHKKSRECRKRLLQNGKSQELTTLGDKAGFHIRK
jgi:hypothetical protein